MKTALLFPGQGSQYIGMGAEICSVSQCAKQVFEYADEVLKENFSRKMFQGSESFFDDIRNTQLSIFITSVAVYEAVKEKIPHMQIDVMAGHSLGEYSAMYAAGVIDLKTGISLVGKRGKCMQEAANKYPSGMVAVVGEDHEYIFKCVESLQIPDLYPANVNAYNQIVFSGKKESLEVLLQAAEQEELRVIPLKVKGGFHSPFMEEAKDVMQEHLKRQEWKAFQCSVLSNTDGKEYKSQNEIASKLSRQIILPVQWVFTIEEMIERKIELLVEVGPGKVLTGLSKKIYKQNAARGEFLNVSDGDELQKLETRVKS